MDYREGLVQEDSWSVFDEALDEAVESYVEDFSDHLAEGYEQSEVAFEGLDSREDLVDVLGLVDYSVELVAEAEGLRAYNIGLPDVDSDLLMDVERSVAQSNYASDEDRETVAYNMNLRSDHSLKFGNIRSEFQRLTRPDVVKGDVSIFFRPGEEAVVDRVSSWDFFDDNDLMDLAVEKYEDNYEGDFEAGVDFDVELLADSGKDWRIYEFDFEDLEEPMHLEITMRDYGFSLNWKQDGNDLRYRNFVEYGFAEAIDELTD